MRCALHRLSPGPTIPEMMRAEGEAWRRSTRQRVHAAILATGVWACLAAADLALSAIHMLLKARLITPDFAARVFDPALSLSRLALIFWARSRRAIPRPAPDRRLL